MSRADDAVLLPLSYSTAKQHMIHQTVVLSTLEQYLANTDETEAELQDQLACRSETVDKFPHTVMIELAFAERDYANRWAWRSFGPRNGECFDVRRGFRPSEYPTCDNVEPHVHKGTWCCRWFVKTDYDFGFCEWYFSHSADRDRFLEFVPTIHWGENFH